MELPLLKVIREHLGLKIGEKFKLRHILTGEIAKTFQNVEIVYHFEEEALYAGDSIQASPTLFHNLIYGFVQVVKIPFEPKFNESYWTYKGNDWDTRIMTWLNLPSDFVMLKGEMVFRTEREAIAARPKLYKEYTGKEWNDGKETD